MSEDMQIYLNYPDAKKILLELQSGKGIYAKTPFFIYVRWRKHHRNPAGGVGFTPSFPLNQLFIIFVDVMWPFLRFSSFYSEVSVAELRSQKILMTSHHWWAKSETALVCVNVLKLSSDRSDCEYLVETSCVLEPSQSAEDREWSQHLGGVCSIPLPSSSVYTTHILRTFLICVERCSFFFFLSWIHVAVAQTYSDV